MWSHCQQLSVDGWMRRFSIVDRRLSIVDRVKVILLLFFSSLYFLPALLMSWTMRQWGLNANWQLATALSTLDASYW